MIKVLGILFMALLCVNHLGIVNPKFGCSVMTYSVPILPDEDITAEIDREAALKNVTAYFDAFAKSDFRAMSKLSTERHNREVLHEDNVWGMKWANASEIKLIAIPDYLKVIDMKSTMIFSVNVDTEPAKTSANYPAKEDFFYIVLVKGEDGVWRIDHYTRSIT